MENNRLEVMWGTPILDDGFTSVPNMIIRNAAKAGLNGREFHLVMVIMSYKHDVKDPFPSQNSLSEHMGCSVRYIRKILSSIEDKGLLDVYERKNKNKQYLSNVYNFKPLVDKCLNIAGLDQLPDTRDDGIQIKKRNKKEPEEQRVPTGAEQRVPLDPEQGVPPDPEQGVPPKKKREKEKIKTKKEKENLSINKTKEKKKELPKEVMQVVEKQKDRLDGNGILFEDIYNHFQSKKGEVNHFRYAIVLERVLTRTQGRIYNFHSLMDSSIENDSKKPQPAKQEDNLPKSFQNQKVTENIETEEILTAKEEVARQRRILEEKKKQKAQAQA